MHTLRVLIVHIVIFVRYIRLIIFIPFIPLIFRLASVVVFVVFVILTFEICGSVYFMLDHIARIQSLKFTGVQRECCVLPRWELVHANP